MRGKADNVDFPAGFVPRPAEPAAVVSRLSGDEARHVSLTIAVTFRLLSGSIP